MRTRRSFVRAVVAVAATAVALLLAAPAAMAQSPSATASPVIEKPGPPASYYASYGLVAIAGLTILAVLAGYLYQAPGFRRSRGGASSGE